MVTHWLRSYVWKRWPVFSCLNFSSCLWKYLHTTWINMGVSHYIYKKSSPLRELWVCFCLFVFKKNESWIILPVSLGVVFFKLKQFLKDLVVLMKSHLDQKYDQEVEVGDSSELLEQILGDEVPESVLWDRATAKWISHTHTQNKK